MRAFALVALFPAAAAAHPIEPLVTASPMPTPEGQFGVDASWSMLRDGGHDDHAFQLAVAAGIGGRAEISAGGSVDATAGTIGGVVVGAKVLLIMEGHTPLDLALAASLSTERAGEVSLLAGRTLHPGFYLQLRASVLGSTVEEEEGTVTPLARPHAGHVEAAGDTVAIEGAGALQWSPSPRWLPTLEARYTHVASGAGDDVLWIVPELMFLVDMNGLAVKLGVPIGISGATDVGVIAGVGWQG